MILDTVLLLALPASGKSEVRRYLASLSPERSRGEMHLGETLQLDDYPYVHLMHAIDDALIALGAMPTFYHGPTRPFRDPLEWGTLIELLNEDYARLLARETLDGPSAAEILFERLEGARAKVGLMPALDHLPHRVWKAAARAVEAEARRELDLLNATTSQDRAGKTIVMEAARGGPHGASFPLTPPRGYAYSIGQFSETILARASILYVQVTPEESRRKNIERGLPNAQGSILNHSVPMEVMLGEYGCDDMAWLVAQSDRPDTVRVEKIVEHADGFRLADFHLPVAVFDNREDLTTFVRAPEERWSKDDVSRLDEGLRHAFATLGNAPGEHLLRG
ncbi:MAG: hypothetical protein KC635_14210 [Myxococcales bacterium]|nr:hypothetical protein [Myxococcales bacterium]MCB9732373.1 hypothetical protein [Deltaproteobacteria bacterium]